MYLLLSPFPDPQGNRLTTDTPRQRTKTVYMILPMFLVPEATHNPLYVC